MQDPLIGRQIDAYELRTLLGTGGMARVYRAFDHNLQREVALKMLYESPHGDPSFADRFMREARTLASLQHPGIVPIYNIGQHEGRSYLVQALLPGPTLEQELARLHAQGGRLGREQIQPVIAQLAAALDYAHKRGIIHRDLKPSNVMRNDHGMVVLVDFGIAKEISAPDKLTRTGLVMGTPQYLAPEQAMGGAALTPAVDIYALGIILYEMLSGQVPFDDPTPLAIALAHVNQPPPPIRGLRPDLPPAVEDVVMKALAKAPEYRYQSAGALASALEPAWSQPAVHHLQTVANPALAGLHGQPGRHEAQTALNPAAAQHGQAGQHSNQPQPASNHARHDQQAQPRPAPPQRQDRRPPSGPPQFIAPPPVASYPHAGPTPAPGWGQEAPARPAKKGVRGVVLLVLLALLLLVVYFRPGGGASPSLGQGATPTARQSSAVPSEEPSEPTSAPAPTAAPVPTALALPATPDEAIELAWALLGQAVESGDANAKKARELQEKLQELHELLGQGQSGDDDGKGKDKKSSEYEKKLSEFVGKVDEAASEGQISPELASQLISLADVMALGIPPEGDEDD